MYDQAALSAMKISELKEVAKKLNLKKVEALKKQDLIAKILESQDGQAGADRAILPSFVGNEKDLTELATADEPVVEEDPEPPAASDENGDDDEEEDDEEGEDDDDEDDEEEETSTDDKKKVKAEAPPPAPTAHEGRPNEGRNRPDDRRRGDDRQQQGVQVL